MRRRAQETLIRRPAGQGTDIHLPVAPQLTEGDLLPRLAAARRISTLDEAAARDLAVKYQLATQYTSFVVVAERAAGEQADDLPATIAVPHMLAAGWGSSASVELSVEAFAGMEACISLAGPSLVPGPARSTHPSAPFEARSDDRIHPVTQFESDERGALILSLHEAFRRREEMPRTLHDLAQAHPVPSAVLSVLHDVCIECGGDEEKVIAAFLAWLGANTDTRMLSPDFTAMLRGKVAGLRGFRALRQFMNDRLAT